MANLRNARKADDTEHAAELQEKLKVAEHVWNAKRSDNRCVVCVCRVGGELGGFAVGPVTAALRLQPWWDLPGACQGQIVTPAGGEGAKRSSEQMGRDRSGN